MQLLKIADRYKKVFKRRRKLGDADVLVISHAKSGRTWLASMISHVYHRRCGIDQHELIKFDNFKKIDERAPVVMFSHDNRRNSTKTPLFSGDDLDDKKLVLLVRDPRDVAVSAFFQIARNEGKRGRRSKNDLPMFEYVHQYKLPLVLAFLKRWQTQSEQLDQCVVVRYEDLRERTVQELSRVFDLIDQEVEIDDIEAAMEFTSFERMKQREKTHFFNSDKLRPVNAENPDSFKVRRGKVGGFRDYFTEEQMHDIDALVRDAGLDRFGYGADS